MKQWFAILALLWAMSAVQTAEEHHALPCAAEFHATTISPEAAQNVHKDNAPLLATSAAASGRQFCGPSSEQTKGGRSSETLPWVAERSAPAAQRSSQFNTTYNTTHPTALANTRTTERYIYFLRRIII